MNKKATGVVATLGIMAAVIVVATLVDKSYSFGLSQIYGASLAVCSLVCVTLSATLYRNFFYSIAAGAFFGISSFIFAFIFPSPLFQNPLVSVAPRLFVGIAGYGAYRLAGLAAKGLALTAEKTRVPFSVSVIVAVLGAGAAAVYIVFARSALNAALFFVLLWLIVLAELFLIGFATACGVRKYGRGGKRGREHFALSVGAFFTAVANTALVLPMMYLFAAPGTYGSLADVYAVLMLINFLPELLAATIVTPFVTIGVRRGLRLDVDGLPRGRSGEDKSAGGQNAPDRGDEDGTKGPGGGTKDCGAEKDEKAGNG